MWTAKKAGAMVIAGVKKSQLKDAATLGADEVLALDDDAARGMRTRQSAYEGADLVLVHLSHPSSCATFPRTSATGLRPQGDVPDATGDDGVRVGPCRGARGGCP